MEGGIVRRSVAEKTENDFLLPAQFQGEARPRCGWDIPADNSRGAHVPFGNIGDVHRAAASPAIAGLFPAKLRHHLRELSPLGNAVPVPAVGGGDVVGRLDRRTGPNRNRLLPGVQVRGSRDDVLGEKLHHLLFEVPDLHHLAQIGQKRFFVLLAQFGHGNGSLLTAQGARRTPIVPDADEEASPFSIQKPLRESEPLRPYGLERPSWRVFPEDTETSPTPSLSRTSVAALASRAASASPGDFRTGATSYQERR